MWKLRSMPENAEYGKCGVWKMRKGTLNLLNLPVDSLRDTVTRELLMKTFLYLYILACLFFYLPGFVYRALNVTICTDVHAR